MKNKFLAIVAACTAILGSTLVSAPAHAQLSVTSDDISVDVTVPEILYIKTITSATVDILGTGYLGGLSGSQAAGYTGKTTGSSISDSETSPFTITGSDYPIENAYAVWSNTPRSGGINVTVSQSGGTAGSFVNSVDTTKTLPVVVNTADSNKTGLAAPGLSTAYVGDITLTITPSGSTSAGTYQGKLNVVVDAP